jgi:hypothetical protein
LCRTTTATASKIYGNGSAAATTIGSNGYQSHGFGIASCNCGNLSATATSVVGHYSRTSTTTAAACTQLIDTAKRATITVGV